MLQSLGQNKSWLGMDRVKIQQVVYGPKNLGIRSCPDAYEDGCQFDHDGRHRDLGLFWPTRDT